MEQLFRVKAVARFLDVTPRYVYMLIDDGELGHVRVGKRAIRVSEGQLRAYLRSVNSSG